MKVLLVDDSLFFREVMARLLSKRLPSGSIIEKAGEPFEARNKIMTFDPDVMLLDVEMPNMNGIEFLRRLIVQYNLPTVVSSSRGAYRKLALEAGAYAFVEKPTTAIGNSGYADAVAAELKLAYEHGQRLIAQENATHEEKQLAQVEELVRRADAEAAKKQVRYQIIEEGIAASHRSFYPEDESIGFFVKPRGEAKEPTKPNTASYKPSAPVRPATSYQSVGTTPPRTATPAYQPVGGSTARTATPSYQPVGGAQNATTSRNTFTNTSTGTNSNTAKMPGMFNSTKQPEVKSYSSVITENMNRIMENMKSMSSRGEKREKAQSIPLSQIKVPVPSRTVQLIAIGASTGGTEALSAILKELVPPLPPIVIVQHIPPMFSRLFAERLNAECKVAVKEAANGDRLEPNSVYIAPGDKQMRVTGMADAMQLDVNPGERVNGHCPSVDVLFNSVADRIGDKAMGVILTGMGEDGARGLVRMREQGSVTLGQDEASCVVYGMPRAAFEKGGVVQQVPLSGMATLITNVARYQGGR